MTNQEAIDIIKTAIAQVEWEYPMDYAAAFDMAVNALENGWISVEDRLPEHGKRYLIYATSEGGKNHRITTAAYGGHFALSGRCAYWKVTHWMPLPEPPKEET